MKIGARPRSIVETQRRFADGLSPSAVVEHCLQRIAEDNAVINAFILTDAEAARRAACQADKEIKSGYVRSPLHGVPVAIKDMIDVEGWPTTAGSRVFNGSVANADAVCVANLKAAGAIIIGKTNLHELTVGGHANPWFGKVRNPLDSSRGTGGTSSGSAAAVAAGFCFAAVGTDAAGSNRSPAAATGLVGFKPTNGLINMTGARPTAISLDVIGPITTSVEDARLMTEGMLGRRLTAAIDKGRIWQTPNGAVIARCRNLHGDDVDPAVRQGIEVWLEKIQSTGVKIVEIPFGGGEEFIEAGLTILKFEFFREYGALASRHPELIGDPAHAFLGEARRVDRDHFNKAIAIREAARREFFVSMHGVDAVMVPTSPGLAPRLSDEFTRVGAEMVSYGLSGGRFRRWANMFGMPAIALPLQTERELPASIQLAGLPGHDAGILSLAEALTKAIDDELLHAR